MGLILQTKNKIKADYSRKDIKEALLKVGLKSADTVFSHSNISYFGILEGGMSEENIRKSILEPIMEIIGPEGTFVVPTFSYSFNKEDVFDVFQTPSVCGVLTEIVRKDPRAYRSSDPLFSVAAIGARAKELTEDVPRECFGRDSFWDRFYKVDGVILNMNFGIAVTMFHYIEKSLNVPYRYDKLFKVKVCKNDQIQERQAIYFCRDMTNDLTRPDWLGIDALAKEKKLSHSVDVGRGYITRINSSDLYNLIEDKLRKKPFFMTVARNSKTTPQILRSRRKFEPKIPINISLDELCAILSKIPRDIVSDGYDACLEILSQKITLNIHQYPTGMHCGDWIIPEKWTCYEGHLETLDGRRILSYAQDISCVASYSQSFEGKVSREELFKHLWVHGDDPDLVPAKFIYYQRDWGLCCSQNTKEALKQDYYKVVIKSDFSYGVLKIAEANISGIKDDCIVLCTHLGNQDRANDGVATAAIIIDIFRELQKKKGLKYTYRLLIVPQNFSVAAYLSQNYQDTPLIKGILFLEIFGINMPDVLKSSDRDSNFSEWCSGVFREYKPRGKVSDFILNAAFSDYRPNFSEINIPQLSLSGKENLAELKELIMKMIAGWETNQ